MRRTAAATGSARAARTRPTVPQATSVSESPATPSAARRKANAGGRGPWLGVEGDLPAVTIDDDAPSDVEAEARALADILGGEERLEDAAGERRIDAVAGVGDVDDDGVA